MGMTMALEELSLYNEEPLGLSLTTERDRRDPGVRAERQLA